MTAFPVLQQPHTIYYLMHWGYTISQMAFSNEFSSMKIFKFRLKVPLNLFLNSGLMWIMAWHRTGDKPLSEPMMVHFTRVNSLAPERPEWPLTKVIFKVILVIDGSGICISREIALKLMSPDLFDDKSTSVQVKDWCCQAPSLCRSRCWPRAMSPYGVAE